VINELAQRVSVIVPTYNRPLQLTDLLNDLEKQDSLDFEVVVVDQSSPPLAEQCKQACLRNRLMVTYCHKQTPNLPAARNCGIEQAQGDIVLFIDDDARAPSHFVRAHASNYTEPSVMAVAGSVLSVARHRVSTLPREMNDPLLQEFCACWQYDRRLDVKHAPGGNHSFRKVLVEMVGGFDERYIGPGFREDSDFFVRVSRAGFRIVYDPECWMIHLGVQGPGGCWSSFDGVAPTERFYNHAYFVLKNFPPVLWPKLWFHHLRGSVVRRACLRNPKIGFLTLSRFFQGWLRAVKQLPRGPS
jgi:glycosyltransferase involved in cell wall biosynthesis